MEPRPVDTQQSDGSIVQTLWVPFGEGLEIPASFNYRGTGPFAWELVVQVRGGKPECVRIICDADLDGAISAEAFRRLPLGRLVEEASLMAARPVDEIPRQLQKWKNLDEARAAQAEAAKQYRRAKRSPRQHIDVTDERLQEVARVYRANLPQGRPTAAVGELLGYSRPYAGRLVMLARQRGLLPPTEPRKARG
jgi:hypothetical protein